MANLYKPTEAQLAALRTYAEKHGRTWKQALLGDWQRATYPSVDHNTGAHLQFLRNALGPSWLIRFRLVEPLAAQTPEVQMVLAIGRVIRSADAHGAQSDPDHTVGDLEGFIRHLAKHAGPEVTLRAVETWFSEENEEWQGDGSIQTLIEDARGALLGPRRKARSKKRR